MCCIAPSPKLIGPDKKLANHRRFFQPSLPPTFVTDSVHGGRLASVQEMISGGHPGFS
jgi:hypothetical protein